MTIKINKPELEALIHERMKSGGFQNVEDVLLQALNPQPRVQPIKGLTSQEKEFRAISPGISASRFGVEAGEVKKNTRSRSTCEWISSRHERHFRVRQATT